MSEDKRKYIELCPGQWLASTRHLTLEERAKLFDRMIADQQRSDDSSSKIQEGTING
jgi:hypothetical protein